MITREGLVEIENRVFENLNPGIKFRVFEAWMSVPPAKKVLLFCFLFLTRALPEKYRLLFRRRFLSRLQVARFDYKNFPENGMLRSRVLVGAADIEAALSRMEIKNQELEGVTYPVVSIILATYNRSGLLFHSVLSLLKSEYKEVEIIIVDDCSPDETPAVIKQLMKIDSRIFYIRNAANIGPVRARDEGMKIARGEFIAFHDDDDIAHPNRISAPLAFLNKKPNVDACYCDFDIIVDGARFTQENKLPFSRENYFKRKIMIGSAIMLYRKAALIKCPFSPEYNHAIDFDWILRATREGLNIEHCRANVLDYYSDSNIVRLAGRNPESKKQHREIIKRERALEFRIP